MSEVVNKARRLGIDSSIRFLGVRSDVNMLYQAFDVLMLPSTYEGLSVAAIEAQASALPILISDQVSKETGVIPGLTSFIPLKDAQFWADQLCGFSSNHCRADERRLICSAGYDIAVSASSLGAWYSSIR